jgi:aryl-alcohol dehydrogenase-like predicted oxidoreductase/predicted kinase
MTGWLDATELRIGLGCMRLVDADPIVAAADAGVSVFDTARSYEGNEELLARALRGRPVRVVTKGGMARPDGRWAPDGRGRTLRADCEASLEALDGLPIDLYLVHAPDPRTPWSTTVRALAKLVDEGLVRHIGVANVNRKQLDEALELAPLAAVQVAVSVFDDRAIRGGVIERCEERGLTVIAHSPLGGPRRIARLRREGPPVEEALAWVLSVSPSVVAIPGARTVEAVRSAVAAASLELAASTPRKKVARRDGEVVLVMGIPGAGKSRTADRFVAAGYVRLNRDERGGTLTEIAAALDGALREGETRAVLDNTYLTRAQRSLVIETAAAHGMPVRCLWLDTPLAQAQVNMIERLLDHFGALPSPEQLRAMRGPGLHTPTSQMRAARELEEPDEDEGFERIERIPFERTAHPGVPGVFVAASVLDRYTRESDAPQLVFDWRPGDPGPYEHAVCTHAAGPPVCWCRPPLPGLLLEFARRESVAPERSVVVGESATHRTLAKTLGARFVPADL